MTPSRGFVLLAMLFCHVLDDYGLEGCMKDLKQKSWWRERTDDRMYGRDYLAALACHAVSWTFMVMLPAAWRAGFRPGPAFFVLFPAMAALHAYIDDAKANRGRINLVTDQVLHLVQILCIFATLVLTEEV